MQINIKHLIKPTYMMWMFAGLSIIFLSVIIIIWNEWKDERETDKENNRIKKDIHVDRITTESDKYITVTEFYVDIMSTYGVKYNHRKGKSQNQGLNHYQRIDTAKEIYQLSKLLNISYMLPMSIAQYESAFRPYIFTTNSLGEIIEMGLYQHRSGAVGQAFLYSHQLPQAYKKRCAFYYEGPESLKDPINATRIELVLLWGEKRTYANNRAFFVSSRHWGQSSIYPLWSGGITPDENFIFDKDTIKEDSRNPLMYYSIIRAYETQFNKFNLKVWVETSGYAKLYKKKCSKMEWGYIEGWKYAQTQIKIAKLITLKTEQHKEEVNKLELKYLDNIKKLDNKYRELNGYLKRSEFKKIEDIFSEGMAHFKWLRNTIRDDEKKIAHKIFVVLYAISLLIMFVCTFIIGLRIIIWVGRKIFRKKK